MLDRKGLLQIDVVFLSLKVYKAIFDSLENRNVTNCIVLSIILKYIIFIIKLWMSSVYT